MFLSQLLERRSYEEAWRILSELCSVSEDGKGVFERVVHELKDMARQMNHKDVSSDYLPIVFVEANQDMKSDASAIEVFGVSNEVSEKLWAHVLKLWCFLTFFMRWPITGIVLKKYIKINGRRSRGKKVQGKCESFPVAETFMSKELLSKKICWDVHTKRNIKDIFIQCEVLGFLSV